MLEFTALFIHLLNVILWWMDNRPAKCFVRLKYQMVTFSSSSLRTEWDFKLFSILLANEVNKDFIKDYFFFYQTELNYTNIHSIVTIDFVLECSTILSLWTLTCCEFYKRRQMNLCFVPGDLLEGRKWNFIQIELLSELS